MSFTKDELLVVAKYFGLTDYADLNKLNKGQLQILISKSPMNCSCKNIAKMRSKKRSKSPSKQISKKRSKSPSKQISKKRSKSPLKRYCQEAVSRKIAINMKEERYKSPQQAIAVAYAQVRKAKPECKRYTKKK